MWWRSAIVSHAPRTMPAWFGPRFAKVPTEHGNLATRMLCQFDHLAKTGDFLTLAAHAARVQRHRQRGKV